MVTYYDLLKKKVFEKDLGEAPLTTTFMCDLADRALLGVIFVVKSFFYRLCICISKIE